jgi:hypothetical protein
MHERFKNFLNQYTGEIRYLKLYLAILGLFILLSFSVVIIFNEKTVSHLGDEDQLFEWLGFFFLLISSLFFFLTYLKTRSLLVLVLAIVMFAGAGEEISWGQRIFGFKTPEMMKEFNVQKEFTIHNLVIFNNKDLQHTVKHGLGKLLSINFLFKLFVGTFGIILPLCVYHINVIGRLASKFRVPVPPVSIGSFFLISWIVYQFVSKVVLPSDCSFQYFDSVQEIFETSESGILFIISIYFFNECGNIPIGKDIKQVIQYI